MLWTILSIAVVLAAIAYIALAVRRARREHRARSDERAALLLAAMHGRGGGPKVETTTAAPLTAAVNEMPRRGGADQATATASSIAEPDAPPAPALAALRRPRFLTDPQRLLYLILRAALPDHIVMANTRMIDLLDLPAGDEALDHDPRLREMLHQRIDCVVCRNDLVPVAAMVVYAAAMPRAPDEQKRAETLRELGIKFLRFRADSLPRPAEMRTLVLS
ncbi:MAG: DUF2726 domain-containing protein [Betaproteobacteria bacterium]|nr:DUF2726 domain-containing protein [Betaproteobacteria bacterium]